MMRVKVYRWSLRLLSELALGVHHRGGHHSEGIAGRVAAGGWSAGDGGFAEGNDWHLGVLLTGAVRTTTGPKGSWTPTVSAGALRPRQEMMELGTSG